MLNPGGAGWHLPMWVGLLFLMNNTVCTFGDRNLRGCLWGRTNPAGHKEGASLGRWLGPDHQGGPHAREQAVG